MLTFILLQTTFEYQMSLEPIKQTCCSLLKHNSCKTHKNEPCGARFGTAIASVKDLNLDGYNDIVIGSPLEDDHRGAVYIYHGNGTTLRKEYAQVGSMKLRLSVCYKKCMSWLGPHPTLTEINVNLSIHLCELRILNFFTTSCNGTLCPTWL